MKKIKIDKIKKEKVKTTILLDKSIKKLAQMYAIENDITLQEVVEKSLSDFLTK